MQRKIGIVMMLISAAAFGTLALCAHYAREGGVDTPTLMLLRFGIATLILLPICFLTRQKWPSGRTLLGLIFMGVVLYVGQSYTYFTALETLNASLASLLLYLYPGLVTLGSVLFLHERMTPLKVGALALAFVGSMLTIGPISGGLTVGIVWGVLAAVFYSAYILMGTKIMAKAAALPASTIIIASAGVFYVGLVGVQGASMPTAPIGWYGVVGLAVASVVAIGFLLAGLDRIGPVNASTISALEPVVTALLGALFMSQPLTGLQIFGGVLILSATVILARAPAKDLESPEHPE